MARYQNLHISYSVLDPFLLMAFVLLVILFSLVFSFWPYTYAHFKYIKDTLNYSCDVFFQTKICTFSSAGGSAHHLPQTNEEKLWKKCRHEASVFEGRINRVKLKGFSFGSTYLMRRRNEISYFYVQHFDGFERWRNNCLRFL